MEQLHAGDGLEVDVEGHVRHHFARKILKNFSFIKTFLCVPSELTPSLHPLHRLGRNLQTITYFTQIQGLRQNFLLNELSNGWINLTFILIIY